MAKTQVKEGRQEGQAELCLALLALLPFPLPLVKRGSGTNRDTARADLYTKPWSPTFQPPP